MYECFHCGCRSVIWDNDFSFEDYGYDEDGLIHECHCTNCGANITYMIPFNNEDERGNDIERGKATESISKISKNSCHQ